MIVATAALLVVLTSCSGRGVVAVIGEPGVVTPSVPGSASTPTPEPTVAVATAPTQAFDGDCTRLAERSSIAGVLDQLGFEPSTYGWGRSSLISSEHGITCFWQKGADASLWIEAIPGSADWFDGARTCPGVLYQPENSCSIDVIVGPWALAAVLVGDRSIDARAQFDGISSALVDAFTAEPADTTPLPASRLTPTACDEYSQRVSEEWALDGTPDWYSLDNSNGEGAHLDDVSLQKGGITTCAVLGPHGWDRPSIAEIEADPGQAWSVGSAGTPVDVPGADRAFAVGGDVPGYEMAIGDARYFVRADDPDRLPDAAALVAATVG